MVKSWAMSNRRMQSTKFFFVNNVLRKDFYASGSSWIMKVDILDASKNVILKIVAPCCICDGPLCPRENKFLVILIFKIKFKKANFIIEKSY